MPQLNCKLVFVVLRLITIYFNWMTAAIVLTVCVLLLIAYVFDLSASRTRIPAVILLLALGVLVRQLSNFIDFTLPDLKPALPVLGTVGLILIVLEGALELELNRSKKPVIIKSFIVALVPMVCLALLLAYVLNHFTGYSYRTSLINIIPLCVISSAIAIPSVRNRAVQTREFIIYESSFSDVLGVLLFNFISLNTVFGLKTFGNFGMQLLIISAISFVATIAMAFLLSKIEHHIKFAPIILLIIVIYEISKIYHLPGLIFILVLGLFLGNFDELQHFNWVKRFKPEVLNKEVQKFKELTAEATFLTKSLFFLLFGYLIEITEVLNSETFLYAAGIAFAIYIIRAIQLKILRLPLKPLLFIAPRGLITILLFLAVAPAQKIPLINNSLIIQLIVITAFVMMFGLMFSKKLEPATAEIPQKAEK